jgi:nitrilase
MRVVSIDGVRFGLTICYDLRFPRLFDAITSASAECILVTAAFTEQTGKDHWHPLLRARAIENQIWIAAAAQWGSHPGHKRTYGHSLICDPWGTVVAERGEGPGVVTADLDLSYLTEVRRRLPCHAHRRDIR